MVNKYRILLILIIVIICSGKALAGNCLDNSKKIAVYLPNTGNISFDPMCNAMFFEYNLSYVTDANINSLKKANYSLLLVPSATMSNFTATRINDYLSSGGHVWFFLYPENNDVSILKAGPSNNVTFDGSELYLVNNSDSLTYGLPSQIYPANTGGVTIQSRVFNVSGKASGMNFETLISENKNNASTLVKFWNSTSGGKAIYSTYYELMSGGQASFFSPDQSTTLFDNCKSWLLDLDSNKNHVSITYPGSDKQFTFTIDDVCCSSSDVNSVNAFFNMEKSNNVNPSNVNTFFVIPNNGGTTSSTQGNTTLEGINYFASNGDTHTLHPHFLSGGNDADWITPDQTVSQEMANITSVENIMNNVASVSNYGFTSFRFPMTSGCLNAQEAVINSGFNIDSSHGLATTLGNIGDIDSNTIFLPKQILLNNCKTNEIEIEVPSVYDIDENSSSDFANDNEYYIDYFSRMNFPSNYLVGGHYQGIMTNESLMNGTSTILKFVNGKSCHVSYSTLNQIASYTKAIREMSISVTDISDDVTVNVKAPIAATNFTIKTSMNDPIAQVDGKSIPSSQIIKDGDNVDFYIITNLSAGSHTINLTSHREVGNNNAINSSTDNTSSTANVTQTETNTSNIDQSNGNTPANTEHTPAQTATTTPTTASKKSPGFEIIGDITAMLGAVYLYRKR